MRHSKTKWWIGATAAAAIVVAAATIVFIPNTRTQRRSSSGASHQPISARSVSLPLYFEPNQGQIDPQVKYLAHGAGFGLFFTDAEAVLDLERPATKDHAAAGSVIRMHLEGASPAAQVRGTERLQGRSNYFLGKDPKNWRTDIPQFGQVEYRNVYPGIDLVYYGKEQQLEYDFRVAPGAEPNLIALTIQGASAHIDSGDLVLTTSNGDVRFHAPHIYQKSGSNAKVSAKTEIPGSFRLLASNKVGFSVGSYDRKRELIIDPTLTFSTYLGGSGIVAPVSVAVDSVNNIYVAGSTTGSFPVTSTAYQGARNGGQNVFVAVLTPSASTPTVYATYLGGSGTDTAAGVAVNPLASYPNINVYVGGTTSSSDFPTSSTAFQTSATFNPGQVHGFVTNLNLAATGTSQLAYSSFLAGTTGSDTVTGVAADASGNVYVTGHTTSIDGPSNGFPSNSYAYQPCPFSQGSPVNGVCLTSGPPQFFASKINTNGSGAASMLYSTYFGGQTGTTTTGGGIAVDSSGNMYFTGTTNMQNVTPLTTAFPIVNAAQQCLDTPTETTTGNGCTLLPTTAPTDAILVKLSPSQTNSNLYFSTYLGGSGTDAGTAVAVDSTGNAYVTGNTVSTDWNCVSPCVTAPTTPTGWFAYNGGGNPNAFIAKVTNLSQGVSVYPLSYFAYIGDTVGSFGQAIAVDSIGTIHVAGTTNGGLVTPLLNPLPGNAFGGGASDAFVALVLPQTTTTGDYITYLGGNGTDQGTGIAVDSNNNTYVAGTTTSTNFPVTNGSTPGGTPDAFATVIGSIGNTGVTVGTTTPTVFPSPVAAGQQAAFTFTLTNGTPDPATNVNFYAKVPTGYPVIPTAKIDSGIGSCAPLAQGANVITCLVPNMAAGATATVEVDVTPPTPAPQPQISVQGCTNPQILNGCASASVNVVDFTVSAPTSTQTVTAGAFVQFQILLTPSPTYNATISLGQTTSPSMVTSATPYFNPTTVTLNGTGQGSTTLNIQTVPRPVTVGKVFRRGSFYATWLPIGGLSLAGLGIGAGRKRRRWVIGLCAGLLVGLLFLQPACSSNSSNVTTNQGTAAGKYTITVKASSATNSSHQILLTLYVN